MAVPCWAAQIHTPALSSPASSIPESSSLEKTSQSMESKLGSIPFPAMPHVAFLVTQRWWLPQFPVPPSAWAPFPWLHWDPGVSLGLFWVPLGSCPALCVTQIQDPNRVLGVPLGCALWFGVNKRKERQIQWVLLGMVSARCGKPVWNTAQVRVLLSSLLSQQSTFSTEMKQHFGCLYLVQQINLQLPISLLGPAVLSRGTGIPGVRRWQIH